MPGKGPPRARETRKFNKKRTGGQEGGPSSTASLGQSQNPAGSLSSRPSRKVLAAFHRPLPLPSNSRPIGSPALSFPPMGFHAKQLLPSLYKGRSLSLLVGPACASAQSLLVLNGDSSTSEQAHFAGKVTGRFTVKVDVTGCSGPGNTGGW